MTAYRCPSCQTALTMRPLESRQRHYCFEHADDFAGCDLCGVRYCRACADKLEHLCKRCNGRLHDAESFAPSGNYRLPFGETSVESARQRTEQLWQAGLLATLEYQTAISTIEQIASETESD